MSILPRRKKQRWGGEERKGKQKPKHLLHGKGQKQNPLEHVGDSDCSGLELDDL